MRFTFISCSQKLQATYLSQRAHCVSSNNPGNLWGQQTGFPGQAEKIYKSVQWKWKWFHHFLMSRTSLSLGRKNAPRVEVEVYRPKMGRCVEEKWSSWAYSWARIVEELAHCWLLGLASTWARARQREMCMPRVLYPHGKTVFPEHQSSTASTWIFHELSFLCWTQVPLKHLLLFTHGLSCLCSHWQWALHPIPPACCLEESGLSWHHSVKR